MVILTFCVPQGVVKTSVKFPRVLFSDSTLKVLPATLVTSILFAASWNSTVPLGFTVKLTLPKPRFEIENGLGLVVTWTTHGVGDALGLADGDAPGEAEGLAPGEGLTLALGDGSAPGEGDGSVPGDASGLAVGDAVGVGSAVGLGVGSGLLLPLVVDPLSMPLRFDMALTFGTSSR
jgi:hypothetical protein